MPHLLVVEDDPQLRGALVRALRDRGHAVATAATGMSGLDAAVTDRPDLVVLDLGLPDVDGAQVLRMLRAVSEVPVIVATARDEEPDMVAVLGDGADDYIVKPFGAAQLDARIKAVLRRLGAAEPEPALRVGELVLDTASREVTLAGRALDLTPREFDLLAYLGRRAGQVVSRRELLAEVWQQPLGGADKTVDVHLSWLRRKLGETAQRPRYLHTVRTVGVKLSAPEAAGDTGDAGSAPRTGTAGEA
ncbi:response regulator transcription factor [Streptomyces sp. NPDC050161]|uniref:response regulator transcription factor n=1 Tax=Streptomyces sp. NPDC050161 TaxID=3365604 RepID=UPI0037AFCC0A